MYGKEYKTEINRLVGASIRAVREENHMTRDELASMLGLTTSHMGLMERGDRGAHPAILMMLSERFNVPITEFFAGTKGKYTKGRHVEPTSAAHDESDKKLLNRVNTLARTLSGDCLELAAATLTSIAAFSKRTKAEGK